VKATTDSTIPSKSIKGSATLSISSFPKFTKHLFLRQCKTLQVGFKSQNRIISVFKCPVEKGLKYLWISLREGLKTLSLLNNKLVIYHEEFPITCKPQRRKLDELMIS
jgi:hypothetical protein